MVAEALVHPDREGLVEKMFPGTITAGTGWRENTSQLSSQLSSSLRVGATGTRADLSLLANPLLKSPHGHTQS